MKIIGPQAIDRAIHQAGEWQDQGFHICFLIPNNTYLDNVYHFMVHDLDMSRVSTYTQGQIEVAVAELGNTPVKYIGFSLNLWDGERRAKFVSIDPDLTTEN
jgi:hypothetical protein